MLRTACLERGTFFFSPMEQFKRLYGNVFDHFILLQLWLKKKKSPQVFLGGEEQTELESGWILHSCSHQQERIAAEDE